MNGDVMNMLSSVMQDPKAMEKAISMARTLSSSGILDGFGAPEQQSEEPKANLAGSAVDTKEDILPSGAPSGNEGSKVSMNQRVALLLAIRPYLAKDKAEKLDRVVAILKVMGTLESSGIKLF